MCLHACLLLKTDMLCTISVYLCIMHEQITLGKEKWTVHKRYQDFQKFHEEMKRRHPQVLLHVHVLCLHPVYVVHVHNTESWLHTTTTPP